MHHWTDRQSTGKQTFKFRSLTEEMNTQAATEKSMGWLINWRINRLTKQMVHPKRTARTKTTNSLKNDRQTFSSCKRRWCSHNSLVASRDVKVSSRKPLIRWSSCTMKQFIVVIVHLALTWIWHLTGFNT